MQAYMKHHFSFLGIPTPARRAACLPVLRTLHAAEAAQLLVLAQSLWALPEREYQYVAIDVLAKYEKKLSLTALPNLLALVQEKSWWDSVDGLAGVVGDVVRRSPAAGQAVMDEALHHSNLWVRRVAMLHQLGWRAQVDAQRLFAYALQLAPEQDFFIRKAIGWALRDYARHNPQAVRDFLAEQGKQLSPLSVREAAKHL
ncbi:DNA alkylation repair protein [Parvibium lacunae]|uniref:DNA alkylation repair protein n=2 Tax=Parvibium lacunae TaxID=1888893 RepID=A0A368L8J1_9BURK|nr:DNA alkylation repair protein [Parvibium lacunae]